MLYSINISLFQNSLHFSEIKEVFTFPLIVDGDGKTDPCALNVDADSFIEWIARSIGVLDNEGVDLLREVLDAVNCGHTEVAGLSVVGLHLRIAGNRSLLRARKAQEGDYHQDKVRNQRTAQNADTQRFTPPL